MTEQLQKAFFAEWVDGQFLPYPGNHTFKAGKNYHLRSFWKQEGEATTADLNTFMYRGASSEYLFRNPHLIFTLPSEASGSVKGSVRGSVRGSVKSDSIFEVGGGDDDGDGEDDGDVSLGVGDHEALEKVQKAPDMEVDVDEMAQKQPSILASPASEARVVSFKHSFKYGSKYALRDEPQSKKPSSKSGAKDDTKSMTKPGEKAQTAVVHVEREKTSCDCGCSTPHPKPTSYSYICSQPVSTFVCTPICPPPVQYVYSAAVMYTCPIEPVSYVQHVPGYGSCTWIAKK